MVAGADTTVDVTLGTVRTVELSLGVGTSQEIDGDGALHVVENGGEFGLSSARVNTKAFPWLASGTTEIAGRQYVLGPIRTAGLLYTRKVFSSLEAEWVRTLEVLENPGAFDIEVRFALSGDISVDSTSSGDVQLDPDDRFFIDSRGVAVVYAGGALGLPDATRARSDDYELEWRRLTVPAGGRIFLMHFAVLTGDPSSAETLADQLMELTIPEAINDLSAVERLQVVNFEIP